MLLITHVIIALAGLVLAGTGMARSSKTLLQASAGATILTFISGFVLVLTTRASITSACLSGTAYLSVVSILIGAGYRKLTAEKLKT